MQLSTLEQAQSILPHDLGSDSSKKQQYLKWRLCGFDNTEAASRAGVTVQRVEGWYSDPEFVGVMDSLWEMQTELAENILRQEETKNRIRLAELDGQVLDNALTQGLANLDKNSFEHLQATKKGLQMTTIERAKLGVPETERPPASILELREIIEVNNAEYDQKNGQYQRVSGKKRDDKHNKGERTERGPGEWAGADEEEVQVGESEEGAVGEAGKNIRAE